MVTGAGQAVTGRAGTGRARRSDAHVCGACGFDSPRWFGRCPECGAWAAAAALVSPDACGPEVTTLASVDDPGASRLSTGTDEVDRVLGGGLVAGGVVLLAGEPGIGKSTLVLQVIDGLLGRGHRALLVTGEESLAQVALRGSRLGISLGRLRALASASLEGCLAAASAEGPDVVVVDSIQTLLSDGVDSAPGSVTQVRECAAALVRFAKATGTAVILVGHVTKDGSVSGPKTLEHVVDAVCSLEGERSGTVRLLRALKNRYGSCDETGVFVMGERGLVAVPDPSAMLLADRRPGIPGSAVFCGLEGSRPMLVEIQALAADSDLPQPRRVPIGIDGRRMALLMGVMLGRCDLRFPKQDVFLAVAGGIAVREPACDLALCLALDSARSGICVDASTVAIGEIGLGGEARRVPGIDRRLAEAARLGFLRAVVPCGDFRAPPGMKVVAVRDVAEALIAGRAPLAP